ncbi:dialkylresorcinol condensing enzyme DarA [Flavobacterium azooxidireducens]|uniref:Dialkylresorcinol condensing enzyme DarA n=1 Tax=Flavobacterium azooxidireducens TaxID=1871076 RepID=A0ABY4KKK2_9FLAO|nr:dialkylrecorsinol condensing enzyme DarA [Flavobacterium azooxidireducens]UPQ79930.1 dialkylresorcinol condensing enzyme DarA [Flavobacterium azooxidireducens]
MKNVIVIYYTQSGQLAEIAQNIAKPLLNDEEISVTFYNIEMEKPFPFPWPKADFFDAFPESFLQIPAPIHQPSHEILSKKYDLVILAYQVWYLTPSIPINSFLKSDFGQQILKDTPVVTVIGARNMWIMAQEKMKISLKNANAKLVGNIALVDRHINHISVITIVHWMFTGKKTKYLGFFPKPGVSDEEISNSSKFGEIIVKHLKINQFESLQKELVANDAVEIRPFLIEMDKKANKMFTKWANFIITKTDSRPTWLKFFNLYLFVAIWIISPIVYILHLFSIPFKTNQIKKEKTYFKGV